jgi:transposase InsO family protein
LRRQRYTGKQIARELEVSPATVSRIHIDIKKLGKFNQVGHRITGDRRGQSNSRGVGWEYVHVCIDDHSRIAFAKIMANEKKRCAIAFLRAALAYYPSLGIKVEGVMTDNGSCYRSFAFRRACKRLGLKHIRTRPYTPKTNGKAERFIQTSLREWAYAQAYEHSRQRKDQLPAWLQLA